MKLLPTDPSYDHSIDINAVWARIESAFEDAGIASSLADGATADEVAAMEATHGPHGLCRVPLRDPHLGIARRNNTVVDAVVHGQYMIPCIDKFADVA